MVDPSSRYLRPGLARGPRGPPARTRPLAAQPRRGLLMEFQQGVARGREVRRLLDRLPQEAVQVVLHVDGHVDQAIAAAAVGADGNQVFVVAVGGHQLADRRGRLEVLRRWRRRASSG